MTQSIQVAEFYGTPVRIIDHAGKKWLTAEEVGHCLGYAPDNARKGILKIYERNADEFTAADTGVVKLTTPGGLQDMRIFSVTGCNLLGFFSNTAKSKEFRLWAKQALAEKLEAARPAIIPRTGRPSTITRRIERLVLERFVKGQRGTKIADALGISQTTVNQLIHAKYQFAPGAGESECSPELVQAVAMRHLEAERERWLESQQRLAQRLRSTANNTALAAMLDQVGQHLQHTPDQVMLPLEGGVA